MPKSLYMPPLKWEAKHATPKTAGTDVRVCVCVKCKQASTGVCCQERPRPCLKVSTRCWFVVLARTPAAAMAIAPLVKELALVSIPAVASLWVKRQVGGGRERVWRKRGHKELRYASSR